MVHGKQNPPPASTYNQSLTISCLAITLTGKIPTNHVISTLLNQKGKKG
jgi:hypothetical protein